MATRRDIRVEPDTGNGHARWQPSEASIGELLRRLGDDASLLVREEMALAKMEMRESARLLTADLAKVAVAGALAASGGLALTAFLALLIGNLLGAYWAGALIVGTVFLLVGGLLVKNAMNDLTSGRLALDDTMESLREDKRWAEAEAREFKRDVTA